ncbi:MAG: hypothetical protein WCA37_04295 [Terracidiphilus sp.]
MSSALHLVAGCMLLVQAAGVPAEAAPLTAEQSRVLERVRTMALAYTQGLPDFICTQITHRSVTSRGNPATGLTGVTTSSGATNLSSLASGSGGGSDVIEEKLTFIKQAEHYEVLTVDGKKTSDAEHMQFQGAISAGEFGSALRHVFDPESQASFGWDREGSLHGQRVYIFTYKVPKEHGIFVIHSATGRQIVAAHAGRIVVDAGTLQVVKIDSRLELPLDFPIEMGETTVEYRQEDIAGKRYTLPYHSEVSMEDRNFLYVNRIDFKDYHKFSTDSTILYDNPSPE